MKTKALQLGGNDFSEQYQIYPETEWNFEPKLSRKDKEYDVAVICRQLTDEEAEILSRTVRAHCLFFLEGLALSPKMEFLWKSRLGQWIAEDELKQFLEVDIRNYFDIMYGEKFVHDSMAISPEFHGKVHWNGFTEAVLKGDFGDEMKQVAFWRGNIPVDQGQAIDLWLEYKKDNTIEIEMQITQFYAGSVSDVQNLWTFSEEDLKQQVTIDNQKGDGPIFVSLRARGTGTLRLIALHDRHSRRGRGNLLPGGKRLVSSNREEAFTYMDPGDLKPPLCVYFSGYKTMESFEGYHMMRRMGCPFVLVSDSRLEGGAFYLGSREYEGRIRETLQAYMDELGFTNDQLVFSGMSMGTFGALYYGTMLKPKYIILGKPLTSLGNMAEAERLSRPGGFPTSLDLLWKNYGSLSHEAATELNHRFWDPFDNTDWSGRMFITAYMLEDDYDTNAYQRLLEHIDSSGARVVGKGLHGRHNDDTNGIVVWFLNQYERVLKFGYGRELQKQE